MTQVTTLRTGKWANELATVEEMTNKVQEIMNLVTKYGWENRRVCTYGFSINLVEFLDGMKDYRRCTHSSKQIQLSEINGLIKIINKWIEQEEEKKQ